MKLTYILLLLEQQLLLLRLISLPSFLKQFSKRQQQNQQPNRSSFSVHFIWVLRTFCSILLDSRLNAIFCSEHEANQLTHRSSRIHILLPLVTCRLSNHQIQLKMHAITFSMWFSIVIKKVSLSCFKLKLHDCHCQVEISHETPKAKGTRFGFSASVASTTNLFSMMGGIDHLNDWAINRLTHWRTDRLTNWPIDRWVEQSIDQSTV